MEKSLSERLQETFGVPDFPDGLFFEFDYALRFDPAGEQRGHRPRFLKAINRAGEVVGRLFADVPQVSVIVREFVDQKRTSARSRALRNLAEFGFKRPFRRSEVLRVATEDEAYAEAGQTMVHVLHEAVIAPDETDFTLLLWSPMAHDMGVRPIIGWMADVYLVDFERRIAVWPYDDQVMDVVAMDASVLGPLSEQFGDWLTEKRLGP